MGVEQFNLKRKLEREEYILGGIKPSSKGYQKQFQLVKDLKLQLEFLDLQDNPNKHNPEHK